MKKLLITTDSPVLATGLGRIAHELAIRFNKHFDLAIAGWHHLPLRYQYQCHIYPLRKGHPDETGQMQMILQDFVPDVLLAIGDIWDFDYLGNLLLEYKDKKKDFKSFLWVTVDGEYLDSKWSEIVRRFDDVISFSHFGIPILQKYSKKIAKVIYPGLNQDVFYAYKDDHQWSKENMIDVEKTFMSLIVGQNCNRKNIPASIEAFSEFQKGKNDVLLFMVTNPNDPFGYLLWEIVKREKLGSKVIVAKDVSPRTGISDGKLNLLYNMSKVLLNTAIGEGLGLPLMEAQATKCIPMAVNYAAAPEVIGDRGRLFDVAAMIYGEYGIKRAIVSHKSIVKNLNDLYDDWKGGSTLIKNYQEKGLKWIKNFTWDRAVTELKETIDSTPVEKKRSWIKEKISIKDLKILQIVPSWGKNCGIAEYSKELTSIFKKKGKTVDIFASKDLAAAVLYAKQNKFNIVVFQHEYSFFQDRHILEKALDELREAQIKTVIELHTFSPIKIYNNMLLDKADEVIVHCDMFKKNLLNGNSFDNVHVVNMGCKEKMSFDLTSTRENLGLNNQHPIIGSFGFMRDQKGYREIAQAIKRLIPEYPNIKFLLVAPKHEFGSESYEELFYRYIEDLDIVDRVIIVREYMPEEKLIQVLACADLFVLNYKSSRAGGGNSAAIKTLMRAQRAIIVSDTMYFADLRDEVKRISTTEAGDVAKAIKELYQDPLLRKNYIDNANKFLINNTWNKVADNHLSIYS